MTPVVSQYLVGWAGKAVKPTVCVLALAGFTLVGCSSDTDKQSANDDSVAAWAVTIESMRSDGNEFVKSVLADGEISDMEYQEALKLIEDCYAAKNAKVTYDRYGFETVESLDGENDPLELMSQCASADGGIVRLFDQMRRNPTNQSEEELLASCLVREGLVEKGFTSDDFIQVMNSGVTPWDAKDERVILCNKDPLGTLSAD